MKSFYEYFNKKIRQTVIKYIDKNILEIRLRVDKPLLLLTDKEEIVLTENRVTSEDIKDTFNISTDYSAYAYEDNINSGFMSLPGGHRIGFGGSIVKKAGTVSTIKDIEFINFRVCHFIDGCSNKLMGETGILNDFENTIIISPPGLGKTTLLRDMVKNISNNTSRTSICVIDERNEIAGCYRGIPSMDLGIRTDVISNCTKEEGILMAIRSMSPSIIAVDEIGQAEDIEALKYASVSGVKIISTIHGKNVEDVESKFGQELVKIFKNKIIIKSIGDYICY